MTAEWVDDKPTYVTWLWERSVAIAEAEIAWCERTAGRIEAGDSYGLPQVW
jgi:hypothetical protein